MKTTRRGLFGMFAGLFAGFGFTWAKPAAAKLLPPTRFHAAEVAKASEAIARLTVASKEATHRLNELGVTIPGGPFVTYKSLEQEMLANLRENPDTDGFARVVSVSEGGANRNA